MSTYPMTFPCGGRVPTAVILQDGRRVPLDELNQHVHDWVSLVEWPDSEIRSYASSYAVWTGTEWRHTRVMVGASMVTVWFDAAMQSRGVHI